MELDSDITLDDVDIDEAVGNLAAHLEQGEHEEATMAAPAAAAPAVAADAADATDSIPVAQEAATAAAPVAAAPEVAAAPSAAPAGAAPAEVRPVPPSKKKKKERWSRAAVGAKFMLRVGSVGSNGKLTADVQLTLRRNPVTGYAESMEVGWEWAPASVATDNEFHAKQNFMSAGGDEWRKRNVTVKGKQQQKPAIQQKLFDPRGRSPCASGLKLVHSMPKPQKLTSTLWDAVRP